MPPGGLSDFSLDGRVALVTGVGPGIGTAVARGFAAAGAAVALCARSAARLAEFADDLRAGGATASVHVADLADEGDVDRLASEVMEHYGRVDVFFSNAHANPVSARASSDITRDRLTAALDAGSVFSSTREDWFTCLAVNVVAPWQLAAHLVPIMRAHGSGSIVTVVSNAAFTPTAPGMVAYGASKAALATLTRYLARAAGPEVRVNALCPGAVSREATDAPQLTTNPLRRIGHPDDMVGAALFLASDASRFMTGEVLRVDGGRLHASG